VKPDPKGLHKENNMNKNIMRRIFQVWFTLIVQGVILFIAAWTINWLWAWIFLLLGVVILIINSMVIPAEVNEYHTYTLYISFFWIGLSVSLDAGASYLF